MEAKDFRIGNLLLCSGTYQTIFTIIDAGGDPLVRIGTCIPGRYKLYKERFLSECQPIPLTPELLIKFDFIFKQNISYDYYYKSFLQTDTKGCQQESVFSLGRKGSEVFINNNWICGIEYVHQLQNLYFALTGKELTLKQ